MLEAAQQSLITHHLSGERIHEENAYAGIHLAFSSQHGCSSQTVSGSIDEETQT